MRNRVFSAALAILLLFLWLPVYTAQASEGTGQKPDNQIMIPQGYSLPGEPGDIIQVNKAALQNCPDQLYLELGGDIGALLDPVCVKAQYMQDGLAYGWIFDLTADWLLDDFDNTVPASHDLTGVVQLPDGYVYYDENGNAAELLVQLTVTVEETASKTPILQAGFDSHPDLLFLPLDGDVTALTMPENITAKYSRFGWLFDLKADWRFEDFDSSMPGLQMLVGVVQLPDGYAYYDDSNRETDLLIEQQVLVYGPDGGAVAEVLVNDGPVKALLPLGCSASEADDILRQNNHSDEIYLATKEHFSISCPYSWDISAIDLNETGAYMPYTIDLPPGVRIANSESALLTVYVVDPDKIDFTALQWGSSFNLLSLDVEWLYEAQNPTMWYATQPPTDEDSQVVWCSADDSIRMNAWESSANVTFAAPESVEYWFQIRYDDDQYSDYLYVNLNEQTVRVEPWGGDRSGGDREPGGSNEIPDPPPTDTVPTTPTDPPSDWPSTGASSDDGVGAGRDTPNRAVTPGVYQEQQKPVVVTTEQKPAEALPDVSMLPILLASPAEPAAPSGTAVHLRAVSFTRDELEALLEIHGAMAPFSGTAGTVHIPQSILTARVLGEGDVFSVLLHSPAPGQIEVRFWVGGEELTGPFDEPFALELPWKFGEAICTDEHGTIISSRIDSENGLLLLSADRTGIFTASAITPVSTGVITETKAIGTITPATATSERKAAGTASLPFAITGILGVSGAGATFVLRRRNLAVRGRGKHQ